VAGLPLSVVQTRSRCRRYPPRPPARDARARGRSERTTRLNNKLVRRIARPTLYQEARGTPESEFFDGILTCRWESWTRPTTCSRRAPISGLLQYVFLGLSPRDPPKFRPYREVVRKRKTLTGSPTRRQLLPKPPTQGKLLGDKAKQGDTTSIIAAVVYTARTDAAVFHTAGTNAADDPAVETTTHVGPITPEWPSSSDSAPEGSSDTDHNAKFLPDGPGQRRPYLEASRGPLSHFRSQHRQHVPERPDGRSIGPALNVGYHDACSSESAIKPMNC